MSEFLRQQDVFTPHDIEDRDLDLIGAGALGGAVLLVLIKMGFGVLNRIVLWDFDRCALHNLSNQWFRKSHVQLGHYKVEALEEMVAWIGPRNLETMRVRFTGAEKRPLGPVVVLAVDSLEERARIWGNIKQRQDIQLLIDVRMGAHVLELHAVDLASGDIAAYERSLVIPPSGDSFDAPCTERAIFYTVLGGASFVGSVLRAWCRNEDYPPHLVFDFRNFFIQVERPAEGTDLKSVPA